MDPTRFDRLTMILSHRRTRRTVLGLLAALGLTGLVRQEVAAACQGGTGGRCGRATDLECCSGRCVRKRGTRKRYCRQAPGQGICTIHQDRCQSLGSTNCAAGADRCLCHWTTQGYSFCGGGYVCVDQCETNADCEKRDGGHRGDRCVAAPGCCPGSSRACARPCPNPAKA
jgi:hypothetical protein